MRTATNLSDGNPLFTEVSLALECWKKAPVYASLLNMITIVLDSLRCPSLC